MTDAPAVDWTHEVVVTDGVTFRETPERDLDLTIYRPADAEPETAIVFVHGGGWRAPGRGHLSGYAEYFAGRGYLSVTVDHRSSEEATFPASVRDVKAGVRWLHTGATDHGVPRAPERVCVVGASSGGHLAAMAALTPGNRDLDPDADPERDAVAAAGLLYPPTDLPLLAKSRADSDEYAEDDAPATFLGASYDEAPDAYRHASPVAHVDADAPPFCLLHGTADTVVPFEQSVRLREELADAGVFCHLDAIEGVEHGFSTDAPWEERTLGELELFFALAAPPGGSSPVRWV